MTDITPAGATPAPGATPSQTPPADASATPPPAVPATGGPANGEDALGDAGKRALQAERSRAEAAEKELKKLKDANLSADERKDQRIAELERENAQEKLLRQGATLRAEAYATAQRLGFRAPDIAYRLLDPAEVVYAEDGSPKNLSTLLQAVVKEHPYLAGGTAADAGLGPRGAPPSAAGDMNAAIRRAAGH